MLQSTLTGVSYSFPNNPQNQSAYFMNIMKKSAYKKFLHLLQANTAVAAIEFALILPLFIILSLAVIEFGMYFVKDEITNSAVNTVSQALQRNPTYYSQMTTSQINAQIRDYGATLVNFSPVNGAKNGNYICVDTYTSQAAAEAAGKCTSTHFNTTPPASNPYYIVARANLKKGTITPLGKFMPIVNNIEVAQSSGAVEMGNLLPPACKQQGYVLQFDGKKYSCVLPFNVTCAEPWKRLVSDGKGGFTCPNVAYVMAGGVEDPSRGRWHQDFAYSNMWGGGRVNLPFSSICINNVSFKIPKGLPRGQIITHGNLIYPGSGTGNWHDWPVSFLNLSKNITNPGSGGGTGRFDLCIDQGGALAGLKGKPKLSGAERISWTALFIPDSP